MEKPVDLNGFVLAMTETAYAQVKAACDGLTDEQFFCQPTPETNPIAWLIWHMSRARDVITSNISGENQVWMSNGWADRFGMDAEDVGIGDSPEKVSAFHPERSLVMGYLDDAHEATMKRISMIPTEQFDQPVVYALGDTRTVWRALVGMAGDSTQHTGQIAYLRGMFTGMGWRRRAGWS